MTSPLSTFDFNSNTLRVVTIDGEPWFVARDVCKTLGVYVKSNGDVNTTMALRNLHEYEKMRPSNPIGGRMVILISESGLYKLVMRSDKEEAKPFQDWVTREVLPTIRKTGSYGIPETGLALEVRELKEMVAKLMQHGAALASKQLPAEVAPKKPTEITLRDWLLNRDVHFEKTTKGRLAALAHQVADELGFELSKQEQ